MQKLVVGATPIALQKCFVACCSEQAVGKKKSKIGQQRYGEFQNVFINQS